MGGEELQVLTLMLKEITFLFGDIFGLGMSSVSVSSLCLKNTTAADSVSHDRNTYDNLSSDSLRNSNRLHI